MADVCRVEPYGTSGEEVVYLLHPPPNHLGWIDANNPDDPYPEEMWNHFMHFVEALALADCSRLQIGGGRWAGDPFLATSCTTVPQEIKQRPDWPISSS